MAYWYLVNKRERAEYIHVSRIDHDLDQQINYCSAAVLVVPHLPKGFAGS